MHCCMRGKQKGENNTKKNVVYRDGQKWKKSGNGEMKKRAMGH